MAFFFFSFFLKNKTKLVWWHFRHKESTSSSFFYPLVCLPFAPSQFFAKSLWNSHVFPTSSITKWNASLLNVWSRPLPECWPASTHSVFAPSSLLISSSFPLYITSFSFCLRSLPVCLSTAPSVSLSPTDSSDSDLELSTVRHQPEGLDQLQAQTKFTRKELQSLYRGFKNVRPAAGCWGGLNCFTTIIMLYIDLNYSYIFLFFSSSLEQECPSGMVDEETFKSIYSQFFPQGG